MISVEFQIWLMTFPTLSGTGAAECLEDRLLLLLLLVALLGWWSPSKTWEGALAVDHDVDEAGDVSVVNVLSLPTLGKGNGDAPPANVRVSPHARVEVCSLSTTVDGRCKLG